MEKFEYYYETCAIKTITREKLYEIIGQKGKRMWRVVYVSEESAFNEALLSRKVIISEDVSKFLETSYKFLKTDDDAKFIDMLYYQFNEFKLIQNNCYSSLNFAVNECIKLIQEYKYKFSIKNYTHDDIKEIKKKFIELIGEYIYDNE